MTGEPTVLEWTSYYRPGMKGGGPTRSISALVSRTRGIHFRVITGDRDLGDRSPYAGVHTDQWTDVSGTEVWYRSRGLRGAARLLWACRSLDPDVHHLNSMWAPQTSLVPLAAMWFRILRRRPILISPRGEFAETSLRMSRARKAWVGALLRNLVLPRFDVTWHATSPAEVEQIRAWAGADAEIVQIPNLAEAVVGRAASTWAPRQPGTPLRCVYLGRVAPNKNVLSAVRSVLAAGQSASLDVVGPEEHAAYAAECRAAAEPTDRVRFLAAVAAEEVPTVLARYDLFIFPTFNENFGHVIAEALASGTPVLTSPYTPWSDLLRRLGLPLVSPLDVNAQTEVLKTMASMDAAEQQSLRRRVLAARRDWDEGLYDTARQYGLLFRNLRPR